MEYTLGSGIGRGRCSLQHRPSSKKVAERVIFRLTNFPKLGIIIYVRLKGELLMRTQDMQNVIGLGLMTVGLAVFIVLVQILEVIQ
jgi:hypothetical protein